MTWTAPVQCGESVEQRSADGVAASVVLAVCIGIVAYLQLQPLRYETQVGEQRDVLLKDGSRVAR